MQKQHVLRWGVFCSGTAMAQSKVSAAAGSLTMKE
jgi:hypothetical protein